ncbi:MAG: hypothetical protein MJZ78_09000, partial [Bacteroidales bacterium]|nr:hypothetical protein [Bacteroidales bacterium]
DPRPRDYKSRALPLSYAGFYVKEPHCIKQTILSVQNGLQKYVFFTNQQAFFIKKIYFFSNTCQSIVYQ